ncbi:MAG TPA: Calx-beta domain-containing protein, partial [Rhodocyclaceae bacterium]|nr:Calx-beta domain-containing protein [Rhodocyclaceae bacterium]
DARKPEGNSGTTSFVFAIHRENALDSGAAVNWAITGGAANAADFLTATTAGAVTFAEGVVVRYVTIAVKGDTNATESNEDFTVGLSGATSGRGSSASYGAQTATGTILNDDITDAGADTAAGAATVLTYTGSGNASYAVTDFVGLADHDDFYKVVINAGNPANLKAHLSGLDADANLRLYQLGVDGTSLVLKDKSTNAGIQDEFVRLNGLGAGTFYVQVVQYSGETPYQLEIRADESFSIPEAVIFATSADRGEGNSGATPFVFTVVRTGVLTSGSTVNWSVVGNSSGTVTAATGSDFVGGTFPGGVLSFAANVGVMQLTVGVAGDTAGELDEGFSVLLAPGLNVEVSALADQADGVIRNDDVGTDLGANTIAQIGSAGFTASERGTLGVAPDVIADFVGATDVDDFYRFRLTAESDVRLLLTDLNADANLELLDAKGAYVASSAYGGVADEVIAYQGLAAGTYIAHVYAKAGSDTGYKLRLSALPPLPTVRIATEAGSFFKPEGAAGETTVYRFVASRSGDVSREASVGWRVLALLPGLDGNDFDGGVVPSGSVSFAAGETTAVIEVAVAGDSGPAGVEADEPFVVALVNPVDVSLHALDRLAGAVIVNDDRIVPPPSVAIRQGGLDAVKAEGAGGATTSFVFSVLRSGDAEQLGSASIVDWSVSGLAPGLDGTDFVGGVLPSGTVSFASGQVSANITIKVAGDAVPEADDPFAVTLAGADWGAVAPGLDTAVALIRNDDAAPLPPIVALRAVAGGSARAEGGEGAETPFTFQVVRLAGNTDVPVTVFWQVDAPALGGAGGEDFAGGMLPGGSFTLSGGVETATLTVLIAGDLTPEFDESFVVRLTGIEGGVIEPRGAAAIGTILNDDQLTRFGIRAETPALREGNAGTTSTFVFDVVRTGNLLGAADTLAWNAIGLGATGSDFDGGVLPSGTLTFGVGDETLTVSVYVAGDDLVEGNEPFAVVLGNPSFGVDIDPLGNFAVARVLNDDGATPEVSIATYEAPDGEGDSGYQNFKFQLTRSGANLGSATVVRWSVAGAL